MQLAQTYTAPDNNLVKECIRGRQEAFKELYDLYSKAMFNIAVRLLNDREEAADVLQESFISAFKNIEKLRSDQGFGSWIKKIVINRSVDALRRRNRRILVFDDLLHEVEQEEETDFEPEVERLNAAVMSLPDGYRLILTLHLFEDFTHVQIAAKLGISEGTSRSQYARARRRLMEILRPGK